MHDEYDILKAGKTIGGEVPPETETEIRMADEKNGLDRDKSADIDTEVVDGKDKDIDIENIKEAKETKDDKTASDGKIDFRGMGKEVDSVEGRLENFWYHNKWKTIIGVFLAVVLGICVYQYATKDVPDVYLMYAGPSYISAGDVIRFKSAMKDVMQDYNGDGEKGMMLVTLTYSSEEKIEKMKSEAEAESEEFYIDLAANAQNKRQFDMEIFAGEAVICLLDPELYESVREAGGFMQMSEIFTEEEISELSLYDECGLYLKDLKFGKYYGIMSEFPEDAVLCIRKVSTISVFKGKKKYEKLHDYHVDMFKNIVGFEYPEGYVPANSDAE